MAHGKSLTLRQIQPTLRPGGLNDGKLRPRVQPSQRQHGRGAHQQRAANKGVLEVQRFVSQRLIRRKMG